jgi:hypothetical protein
MYAGPDFCSDCRQPKTIQHTELTCLRAQVVLLKEDRAAWKEAWFQQREATGIVAWQWKAPWMRPHLETHLGIPPMKERHGCLGCPMVPTERCPAGECPHCGNMVGPP